MVPELGAVPPVRARCRPTRRFAPAGRLVVATALPTVDAVAATLHSQNTTKVAVRYGKLVFMTSHKMPELDVERLRRYCAEQTSKRPRGQSRVECEIATQYVTIVEYRAPWDPSSAMEWTRLPVARLEYTEATQTWQLYCRDRSQRFQQYMRVPPTSTIEDLVTELDRDPLRTFWSK